MMKRNIFLLSASLAVLSVQSANVHASWYAGGSAGATLLSPDTQDSGFTLDQDKSFLGGLFVGYDFSPRLSAEVAYHYLGSATLSNDASSADISYSALSGSALWYVYGDIDDLAERFGTSAYIRLGLNAMNNVSTLPLERADGHGIWAGIGMEWSLTDNINVRGEISTFDGDAQSANVALVYRPAIQAATADLPQPNKQAPSKPATKPLPKPEVAPAPKPEAKLEIAPVPKPDVVNTPEPEIVTVPEPLAAPEPEVVSEPKPVPLSKPAAKPAPKPTPKPVDTEPAETKPSMMAQADCLSPAVNEPVNNRGCALFSGVQEGLDFQTGTATLTAGASRVLDALAQNLKNHPNTVIELQGHTDLQRNPTIAKSLAKQRVVEVARQLVKRGVSVKRLRARAFGASEPIAANATEQGRQLNNRIVLRVLR
jgi:outer membrane protein OmpA-like peptidoglycan-associated protein